VTNAKTPGARCYGFVTLSSAEDANRSIENLHKTELHGRVISVERVRINFFFCNYIVQIYYEFYVINRLNVIMAIKSQQKVLMLTK